MARLCDHLKGGGHEEGGDVGVGHDEGALLGGALRAGGVCDEGDRPCEEEAHLVRVRVRVRVRDRVRVRVRVRGRVRVRVRPVIATFVATVVATALGCEQLALLLLLSPNAEESAALEGEL